MLSPSLRGAVAEQGGYWATEAFFKWAGDVPPVLELIVAASGDDEQVVLHGQQMAQAKIAPDNVHVFAMSDGRAAADVRGLVTTPIVWHQDQDQRPRVRARARMLERPVFEP